MCPECKKTSVLEVPLNRIYRISDEEEKPCAGNKY